MKKNLLEKLMGGVFLIAACVSILAVVMICLFLFANGIPAIGKIGFLKFLTGEVWRPSNDIYGILPFILGSLYVTAGAIIIGVPIGIMTAVFMARFCPKKLHRILKPAIDLLAGIPSVVYGFFRTCYDCSRYGKLNNNCVGNSCDNDTSFSYQRIGICAQSGSRKLL